jgi:uncharacterized membrane protein
LKTSGKHNPGTLRPGRLLFPALLIAWPVSIHLAIIGGHTGIALLICLALTIALTDRSLAVRVLLALVISAAVLLVIRLKGDHALLPLYLFPVLIHAFLAGIFGRTLLPGKIPMITRYSILLRGRLEPAIIGYTRRVTWLWTVYFLCMALESLLLALFAPLEIWSLFANCLNYVFTALLFTGEYLFRIHHFDHLEHPRFTRLVRAITQVNPSALNKQ